MVGAFLTTIIQEHTPICKSRRQSLLKYLMREGLPIIDRRIMEDGLSKQLRVCLLWKGGINY